MYTRYDDIPAYDTKDGSEIRELMHPDSHGNAAQSLAEAVVAPGATTHLHRHAQTEELYHITRGRGEMRLGGGDLRGDGRGYRLHPPRYPA